ncbi:helix-turn-helix transcriptional regulator [Halopolyspora algeriensis]|uniref:helix-turn-helix transcriptional regulator n=1 Tax=Halopolyspora algeriensis TaxID=1500506 RepID=UPI000DF23035|nr:helix-turn-helix domain-containing protein [Halopolyspora algeriensis]TQM42634.1 AlpA family transcriptional regulator [Halopolyspora algeriensis]
MTTAPSEASKSLHRFLSPKELAEHLGVSKRTIDTWRQRGEGPRAYRVGRHLRFSVEDVEAWLEERAA